MKSKLEYMSVRVTNHQWFECCTWTRISSPWGASQLWTNHYRGQNLDPKPKTRTHSDWKIRSWLWQHDRNSNSCIQRCGVVPLDFIVETAAGAGMYCFTTTPTKAHASGWQLRRCGALRRDVSGNRRAWPLSAVRWFTPPVITPPQRVVDLRWRRVPTEPRVLAVNLPPKIWKMQN